MALYPAAVKKLIAPGPNDPRITARVVILHIAVMFGSLFDYFNGRSGGVESHFYVRLDGTVEQYRDTAYEADANTDANPFAISIETEGMAEGEWTPEQIAAIKALLLWLHETHDIPLQVCPAWNGSGVGYHTLFMDRWAGGPRSCPGPDRIRQFNDVLVPWMASGGSITPLSEEDLLSEITLTNPATKEPTGVATGLNSMWAYVFLNYKQLDAIAAKVGAPVDVDENEIAAALAPLIVETVQTGAVGLSEADLSAIAKAVAVEQARRLEKE